MKSLTQWQPDNPSYPNNNLSDVSNVYVRGSTNTPSGVSVDYSPFGLPQYLSGSSLNNRCQGWISVKDNSDTVISFAGDLNDIYMFRDGAITIVSKTAGGYSTELESFWDFTQYGQYIIATNGVDNPQFYLMGTSTLFADVPGAPVSQFVNVIKDFVVLGQQASNLQQMQWSGIDLPLDWPAPGSGAAIQVQSDIQIVPQGGSIQRIVGGVLGLDGVVFTESMVYTMQYAGYPLDFDFYPVNRARGTASAGSIINQGEFIAFLSQDGFYMFNGSQAQPIGVDVVDEWFWANVNPYYLSRMTSAIDPQKKLLLWSFPSINSTDGTPDTILIYNYVFQKWTKANFKHEFMAPAISAGYTLEQLDIFGALEAVPLSLDARVWSGGSPSLVFFDNVNHNIGYISTNTGDSYIITNAEVSDNGMINYYSSVRPITDASIYQAAVGVQHQLSDTITWTDLVANNDNGECLVRTAGRYVSVKIFIPGGTPWTHLNGYETTTKPLGMR